MDTPTSAMAEGRAITVCEVGPRDGFQSEKTFIPTAQKIEIVDAVFASGVRNIQVTSFVSHRAIPQLADAAQVIAGITRPEGSTLSALIPNLRGAQDAAAAGVDAVHTVVSVSETHNLKNVNCTIAESLKKFDAVASLMHSEGIVIEGGMATAFGCPFEGIVPPEQIGRIAKRYHELGAKRVSLGDTTGMATPSTVKSAIQAIRAEVPNLEICLHFHNTRGVGLACVMTGLAEGVSYFDASFGGLGGCPFAAGATGNICTEDLVYLLQESGYTTGIDLEKSVQIARLAQETLGRELPGQVLKAGPRLYRYDPRLTATAQG